MVNFWFHLRRALLGVGLGLLALPSWGQVCAAPGKDAPGTISGIVNRYHAGNGNLAAGATTLTLGAASGAAGSVTPGDLLLIIQMQGADIDASNDERYGDGTGTAGAVPDTSVSQASGYLVNANFIAGQFEYVRVVSNVGGAVTFTPALTNAYVQNTTAQPRRTYQVIRVPQYPSASIGASSVTTPAWNGSVGGVVAIDVTGALTFSGAGPHIDVSNRGFRGGAQGVPDSACCNDNTAANGRNYRTTLTAWGGGKGEGIAGTPRYLSNSSQGSFDAGTRFWNPVGGTTDNGAGNMGYLNGDFGRGAPANAGGGGTSHNSGGGGGGNGGRGGTGGQTFNGDGLRDVGGYGGSQTPQNGVLLATRIFMGGGGGSGSLNDDSGNRAQGGYGGGIIMLRAGSISGSALLRADGQRGWDSDASNDTGGGGGAGGSVMVIAGSGHGNVTVQARGGNGGDSNVQDSSVAFAPPNNGPGGVTQGTCCAGEREGPGGGGGGGAVYSNAGLGSLDLARGVNGLSREDKAQGNSGNMRSSPGENGISNQAIAASAIVGVREGYGCKPVLTVSKDTTTPTRNVPPDTTATYRVRISNAGTAGWAYGIALRDTLPSPFSLPAPGTGNLAWTGSATYGLTAQPASTPAFALSPTAIWGQEGNGQAGFNLGPGAAVTLTFTVNLNGATAGTYQNAASVRFTDPTRTSGGVATSTTANPTATPGGTYADGSAVGGSNYAAASSTQEDVVVSGAAGTTADFALTKSGTSQAFVGDTVNYTLVITNSGPANTTSGVRITDSVPAAITSVTWVCTVTGGGGDCDVVAAGPGATGSGNAISLPNARLDSGGQLTINITGVATTAGNITNTATVALPPGFNDPVPGNNTGTATATFTTPTADLSISKTNGTTTVAANGVAVYTIVVGNGGPAPVSNAVVTDPARPGLAKLSVTCSASGGASCPGLLDTSTFETTGLTIPNLPVGGTVTFSLSTQVSGTPTVTNTASVTSTVADPNPANNTATDVDTVVINPTRVVSAAQICPTGTTEQLTNLLTNSDFANLTALIGASVDERANNTQPTDTSVATQSGNKNYGGGVVIQNTFPGDPARSVGAANNWLYANGNNTGAPYRLWRQSVSGLVANRTYQFLYYGSNAIAPGGTAPDLPRIQTRVTAGTTTFSLSTATYALDAVTDTWTIAQSTFQATNTAVTIELWDTQLGANGGDFAVTQLLLRECRPNADPSVTKTDGTTIIGVFGTTTYTITVANNNPAANGPADGVAVRDPAVTGLTKNSLSCSATGGAVCPASVTISGLESAGGLTIPTLPFNGTVVFTLGVTNSVVSGSVTNTVLLVLPPGLVDPNTANNTAADVNSVAMSASLGVSKTNSNTTLAAGATTTYVIVVFNNGPSPANGAVVTDPVAAGLTCTSPATCTGFSGASCAASIPAATLQAGYPIPSLPQNSSVSISLTCGVSATGR